MEPVHVLKEKRITVVVKDINPYAVGKEMGNNVHASRHKIVITSLTIKWIAVNVTLVRDHILVFGVEFGVDKKNNKSILFYNFIEHRLAHPIHLLNTHVTTTHTNQNNNPRAAPTHPKMNLFLGGGSKRIVLDDSSYQQVNCDLGV
jgi:hypothetical protein